nr:ARID DNA-binding domain-containing protein [Tanacetum cinerariifolium]
MALNRKLLQREVFPRLPPWSNQKRKLSPEGKEMLKQKVKEIVSFNASKTNAKGREQGESSSNSVKERRARCFTCKKRGHVFWKGPNKRNKIRNEEQNKMLKPLVTEVEEKLKYPKRVHVITDYMVKGSDNGNWDNIWYITNAYKRHMSPTKSLFKRIINRFRMEDVEEKERKFIFSYGVGETTVETKEGSLVIPNVLYTPEITLNVLSIDQLEDQGDLPPVIGVVKVDLLRLYKLVDNLGGYMNVTFGNKWKKVEQLLGLTQDDKEAVKECYKEYIGMDEGPKGEVVGNSSGTAHVKDPLGYAWMSVEIGSALEGTPKKTTQLPSGLMHYNGKHRAFLNECTLIILKKLVYI